MSEASGLPDFSEAAAGAMLNMAQSMMAQGHPYQAMDLYNQVLEGYSSTQAAGGAVNGLIQLAQYFEQNGMTYYALSVYKRLEQLQ